MSNLSTLMPTLSRARNSDSRTREPRTCTSTGSLHRLSGHRLSKSLLVRVLNTQFHPAPSHPLVSGQSTTVTVLVKTAAWVSQEVQTFHAQEADAPHQSTLSSKLLLVPLTVTIGTMPLKSMDGLFHTTWSSNAEPPESPMSSTALD